MERNYWALKERVDDYENFKDDWDYDADKQEGVHKSGLEMRFVILDRANSSHYRQNQQQYRQRIKVHLFFDVAAVTGADSAPDAHNFKSDTAAAVNRSVINANFAGVQLV